MVVQGLIALALAGPTGGLFGLAYGTAIRVGYEIIYPLLFNKIAADVNKSSTAKIQGASGLDDTPAKIALVLKGLTQMYSTVGGLEANAFGINTGVKNAMRQIADDPELVELLKKNSNLLGQNITVNLSGTGLIDSEGRVTSKPQRLDLDPIETLEVSQAISIHQQKAGDLACVKEYGTAFGVAGYDQDRNQVSCKKIVGGQIVSRQPWPPQTAQHVIPKPTEEKNIRKQVKMVQYAPLFGSKVNQTLMLTEFELDQLIRQTKAAMKKLPDPRFNTDARTRLNRYSFNLKEMIEAMKRTFKIFKYTLTKFYP